MEENYEDIDKFSDGDLAEPENLPTGVRFIGEVTKVSTARSEPGNWVKFKEPNQNGDTSAPAIDVTVRTLAFASGTKLPEDKNYMLQSDITYFVGKNDKAGRNSLARLVKTACALSEDELRSLGLRAAAAQLQGAKITYEVKWREGDEMTFQKFVKIKPATEAEKESVA